MIPYGRQDVTEEDVAAVAAVLRSDFLTQGPVVPEFEQAIAGYCGATFGVAANSATSALHVAYLALGLGPGDIFWTSPITFVATSNAALYCGADVDFVDIDPETFNMCPVALEKKLAESSATGRLPKIVAPVHMCGQSCDMKAIYDLSRRYDFRIVEDASHAIGGSYMGRPVGACQFSDIAVFSFHPVKIITTGEGGLAVTNDSELASRMRLFVSHGVTRDPALMTHAPDGPWYYQQVGFGFNYRMTELQAALGLSQFDRLDAYVRRRHEIADRYDQLLGNLPVAVPERRANAYSALHLYVIRLRLDANARSRREVFEALRARGIGVNVHYIPVPSQPHYRALGCNPEDFPESLAYYKEAISLPMYPTLRDDEQDFVIEALRRAVA